MTGIEDNYIALAACILSNKTVDAAFRAVFHDSIDERSGRPAGPVREDTVRMVELQKSMTYEQVGEQYGITAGAVFCRIKRYKKRIKGTA